MYGPCVYSLKQVKIVHTSISVLHQKRAVCVIKLIVQNSNSFWFTPWQEWLYFLLCIFGLLLIKKVPHSVTAAIHFIFQDMECACLWPTGSLVKHFFCPCQIRNNHCLLGQLFGHFEVLAEFYFPIKMRECTSCKCNLKCIFISDSCGFL